jgi:hypothetical protein
MKESLISVIGELEMSLNEKVGNSATLLYKSIKEREKSEEKKRVEFSLSGFDKVLEKEREEKKKALNEKESERVKRKGSEWKKKTLSELLRMKEERKKKKEEKKNMKKARKKKKSKQNFLCRTKRKKIETELNFLKNNLLIFKNYLHVFFFFLYSSSFSHLSLIPTSSISILVPLSGEMFSFSNPSGFQVEGLKFTKISSKHETLHLNYTMDSVSLFFFSFSFIFHLSFI